MEETISDAEETCSWPQAGEVEKNITIAKIAKSAFAILIFFMTER